jgi:hypothetical protein
VAHTTTFSALEPHLWKVWGVLGALTCRRRRARTR